MPNLKNLLINFINWIYTLILKEEMSQEMKNFVLDLGYLTISTIISGVFLFTFNILAGRLLGPVQYGNYSLIISISNLLIVPMLLGFNLSVIKYFAVATKNKEEIITTSLISVFIFTLLSGLIFVLFAQPLAHLFKIGSSLFLFAIIFSAIYAFYSLAKAFMQAINKLKEYAFFEIVLAITIFISFLIFLFIFRKNSYLSPAVAHSLGYLVLILMVLIYINVYFKNLKFNRANFKELFIYGLFATVGSISGAVLGNLDRIVINYFWGASFVGLYSAYFVASMTIISQGVQIFITAFFPAACKAEKKDVILKKLNIISKNLLYILPLSSLGLITLIIFLFGRQYPFNLTLAFIFALNTTFFILSRVYGWFMASEGKRGIRLSSYLTVLAALLSLGLNLALVPKLAILGAAIATLVVSIFMAVTQVAGCHKLFKTA